ncbi:MAG: hypothetical protein K0S55_1070, partial [Clostridia bacterium]|nr:hypothetical protein [Clostridia bacterium]
YFKVVEKIEEAAPIEEITPVPIENAASENNPETSDNTYGFFFITSVICIIYIFIFKLNKKTNS